MRKKESIFFFILFFLISVDCSCQRNFTAKKAVSSRRNKKIVQEKFQKLIPCHKDGRWGYCDRLYCGFINAEGREIIPLKYGWSLSAFHDELTLLDGDNGYCFIDKTGREVTCMSYHYVNPIKEGFAVVRRFDENLGGILSGFVDEKGKAIIPLVYEYVSDFSDGVARVTRNSKAYGYIDRNGVEYFDEE